MSAQRKRPAVAPSSALRQNNPAASAKVLEFQPGEYEIVDDAVELRPEEIELIPEALPIRRGAAVQEGLRLEL